MHSSISSYTAICTGLRYGNFEDFLKRMEEVEGGVEKMSEAYKSMGCHVKDDNTFVCRQWAPAAQVNSNPSWIRVL